MKALICEGAYFLPRLSTQASPLSPGMILYGTRSVSFLTIGSSMRRPISRLIAKNVFSGLVTAWRFAAWPTRRSPDSVNATIDGVVRAPSAFSITLALLPSITATQELVVPRSMPITLLMGTSCQKQDRSARESTAPIPRNPAAAGHQPRAAARFIYVAVPAPATAGGRSLSLLLPTRAALPALAGVGRRSRDAGAYATRLGGRGADGGQPDGVLLGPVARHRRRRRCRRLCVLL